MDGLCFLAIIVSVARHIGGQLCQRVLAIVLYLLLLWKELHEPRHEPNQSMICLLTLALLYSHARPHSPRLHHRMGGVSTPLLQASSTLGSPVQQEISMWGKIICGFLSVCWEGQQVSANLSKGLSQTGMRRGCSTSKCQVLSPTEKAQLQILLNQVVRAALPV
jgi:hypothetical protein